MEKILVEENKEQALQKISQIEQAANEANEKLSYYDDIEGLAPIKTKAEALELFENPATVLDKKIIEAYGEGLKKKEKINARVLAQLYQIPYAETVAAIKGVPLYIHEADFEKGRFCVKETTKEIISERFKRYAESPEEVAAYRVQKEVAEAITNYVSLFKGNLRYPLSDNERAVINYFSLQTEIKDGKTVLLPDFSTVMRKLRYNESFRAMFRQRLKQQ